MHNGTLYMISAPSGSGKTSLVKALLQSDAAIRLSISHTTRLPRGVEKSGVNYHFVTVTQFEHMIDAQCFLEYAKVFGHYYGTSSNWVKDTLNQGTDVILEIDWQGVKQIQTIHPAAITIFILPPSLKTLEDRLIKRGEDKLSIIKNRLTQAPIEIHHAKHYDYTIINNRFEQALSDLKSIIQSNRLRTASQRIAINALLSDSID